MKKLFNVTSISKDVKEFEKRDIVFVTSSDVGYTSKGEKFKSRIYNREDVFKNMSEIKKPVGDDFLLCRCDYINYTWKFKVVEQENKKDSWLSINPMTTCSTYRVGDILDNIENKKHKLLANWGQREIFGYWREEQNQHVNMILEIRIYKDRTFNAVLEIQWHGDRKVFLCLTKESADLMKLYRQKCPLVPEQEQTISDYLEQAKINFKSGSTAWTPVFSDKEVQEKAFTDTVKSRFIERVFGVWGSDIDAFMISSTSDRENSVKFTKENKKMIEDFFGYNSESKMKLKDAFNAKHLRSQDGYIKRTEEDGIKYFCFLESYLLTRVPSAKQKVLETGEKTLEEIWDNFLNDLDDNNLSLFSGDDMLVWHRQDRYIVCAYWQNYTTDRYYYGSNNEVSVFVYDIKKKVRKFAKITKSSRNIDQRIPSLENQILKYIKVCEKSKWDSTARGYIPMGETEVVYLNGLDPEQMFEGTNVRWIIDNNEEIGLDPICLVPSSFWGTKRVSVKSSKFGSASDLTINAMYIIILATTGDKLLEQLLKSKMFKLYFLGLYGIMSAGSQGNMIFRKYGKGASWNQERVYFTYKNGSNLKKMLGLDMNKIKMINDQIEVKVKELKNGNRYNEDSIEGNYYNVPRLAVLPKALGIPMEEITRLDPVSWKKVLDRVTEDNQEINTYRYRSQQGSFEFVAGNNTLVEYILGFKGNIKKVLNFYESFSVIELEKLSDYLQMRSQMETLQRRVDERGDHIGERFFDEKRYPLEVKKAKRFIPYIEGMTDTSIRWGDNIINTPDKFRRYISARFSFAGIEQDSIKFIVKEDIMVGAAVKMNAAQNMNFLHDEMSRWMALYQDPAKAAAFEEATKRVSDFEYKDDEIGLSMISPRQSSDLNTEGKVLSHCVASYIDPVINGTENILFIRRNENISCPYFTMDLVPDKNSKNRFEIRQIHCYGNGDPTPQGIIEAYQRSGLEVYAVQKNIIGFVQKWIEWMKKEKKIQVTNLVSHYGALCALR